MMDSTNSPTYKLAKYLARILRPYDKSVDHVIKKERFPKEEQQNEVNFYDCDAAYVGETSRQLNERLKKHKQCLKHIP